MQKPDFCLDDDTPDLRGLVDLVIDACLYGLVLVLGLSLAGLAAIWWAA
jgi:hypothetical protein